VHVKEKIKNVLLKEKAKDNFNKKNNLFFENFNKKKGSKKSLNLFSFSKI
jgi:hypothetical protein